jgi:uncharacterized surface protein with fasciclin (FAS1) repeats
VEATFWWKPWHHFGEHIPVDYASAAVAVDIAPLEDTAATVEDTATTKEDAEGSNYDAFKAYVDSNPRLSLLSQALDAERTEKESKALQALINDQKDGCTLLAPTNSAMRWFGLTEWVTMPTLVAEQNADSFKMLIDMHVIENETKLIPQLENGEELPTAAGQNLRVSYSTRTFAHNRASKPCYSLFVVVVCWLSKPCLPDHFFMVDRISHRASLVVSLFPTRSILWQIQKSSCNALTQNSHTKPKPQRIISPSSNAGTKSPFRRLRR